MYVYIYIYVYTQGTHTHTHTHTHRESGVVYTSQTKCYVTNYEFN